MRNSMRLGAAIIASLAAALLPAASLSAATPEPSPEQVKFFEEKVRPILAENCYKCHGSEKQKGKLRLDLREMALAGGESGAVIVPGKPDKSLLVEAMKWESLEMPPSGKLSEQNIATLTEWIARRSDAQGPRRRQRHRAAQRRAASSPTKTASGGPFSRFGRADAAARQPDDAWSRGPVDAFLRCTMQTEGVSPAPEADRRTLIRRADVRPDRPAADARRGRRRSWPTSGPMPTSGWSIACSPARSTASAGPGIGSTWCATPSRTATSRTPIGPKPWRYRDYVIRSLNADKPYSRFVLEQLAGDEVAPGDPDALIATAYLRLGIYEYNQRDVRGAVGQHPQRPDRRDGRRVPGPGHGLCPLPRPQVRPDPAEGLLPAAGVLRSDSVARERAGRRADELSPSTSGSWPCGNEATADIRRQIAEIEDPIRDNAIEDDAGQVHRRSAGA